MMVSKFYRELFSLAAIIFLLAQIPSLHSQAFEETGLFFPGAGRCDLSWCDFDNDHDLDVLLTGRGTGEQRMTVLYRNDEGSFTEISASFVPVDESSSAWGDYDADGDKDLLLSGNSDAGDITRIYRNDAGVFTEIDPGIPGIQQGVVIWVDIDNDNDLDIFLSGSWITEIYMNSGGAFTDAGQNFGYFSGSAANFGDYDNDGDLDLLINGDSGAGAVTRIFSNEEGSFIDSGIVFPGLMAGTTDFVDYDLDGDLDVAISGNNDALESNFYLFKNTDKQFEIVYAGIDGFALGDSDWGDYDNDGDPDMLMSGKATGCGAIVSGIYRNEGDDVFTKIPQELTTATRCALAWADYDNDGDLDFLISGLNAVEVPFAKLYRNTSGSNEFAANSAPAAPVDLFSDTDGEEVVLNWSAASDAQTPAAGLSYNFRLGTRPGANDLVSPMADLAFGYRMVTSPGNAGQNTAVAISGLDAGTYYWSVQAIDQAFEGSVFSEEQSFTISTTSINENNITAGDFFVYPNPAIDQLTIQFDESNPSGEIVISDLCGKIFFTGPVKQSLVNINVCNLKPGTYLLFVTKNKIERRTLVIKL